MNTATVCQPPLQPFAEETAPTQASVSLMITWEQNAALRQPGYTDEQIRDMKPEDAHRILGLIG
jgi:hypothetical protein